MRRVGRSRRSLQSNGHGTGSAGHSTGTERAQHGHTAAHQGRPGRRLVDGASSGRSAGRTTIEDCSAGKTFGAQDRNTDRNRKAVSAGR